MLEKILEIMKNSGLIAVYMNSENTDSFCLGRVDYADDEFFMVNEISPKGEEEGIVLRKIQSVFKVEKENSYCKDMEILMKIKNTEFKEYNFKNEELLSQVLKYAIDNELVVTLFYKNDEKQATGFLEEVDNDICKLRKIDDCGYENSQLLIPINEICGVDCDNEKEKKIKLLWKLNSK